MFALLGNVSSISMPGPGLPTPTASSVYSRSRFKSKSSWNIQSLPIGSYTRSLPVLKVNRVCPALPIMVLHNQTKAHWFVVACLCHVERR